MHAINFKKYIFQLSLFLFSIIFSFEKNIDNENCLLCHGLPMLSVQNEEGEFRSFEVQSDHYSNSIHRNISCRDCHESINTFPHEQNIEPVNCAKSCHITRPFEMKIFSHKNQEKQHKISDHGFNPKHTIKENAEKPSCKYCHSNKVFDDIEIFNENETSHCANCHIGESLNNVINHIDFHISHRSSENSTEIVELCSTCHDNNSKMIQFDISTSQVEGFNHHFHGKAMRRGLNEVANCADCHSSHLILSKTDPNSSIHEDNILQTCSSNSSCHQNPTLEFSKSAVHSQPTSDNNPLIFYIEWGFILLTAGVMALLFAHILMDVGRYLFDKFNGKNNE